MSVDRHAIAVIADYVDSRNELELPYRFCNGVTLARYPDWGRGADDSTLLSGGDADSICEASLALLFEYKSAGIGSPCPSPTPPRPLSWEQHVQEQFTLVALAMWLTKPTACAFQLLLFFESHGHGHLLRQRTKVQRLLTHPDDQHSLLDMDDVRRSDATLDVILKLNYEDTLRTALNLLFKALTERLWQARYAFLWIVLEALFGASEPGEIAFRLSQRTALLLGASSEEKRRIFREMKEGYKWRSKLVHGARLAKLTSAKSGELALSAETLIRRALNRILNDSELRSVFEGDRRDDFLDELALGR
jgi:hypothetical protein